MASYKMLIFSNIALEIKNKKWKNFVICMKGLCHVCNTSNVEITLQNGIPKCAACSAKIN